MNQVEAKLVSLLMDGRYRADVKTARNIRFPASYRYENHAHPEVEIDYVNSGCCVMAVEEEIVTLWPGDCILIQPWAKHLYMVDVAKSCSITQLIYSVRIPEDYSTALACFDRSDPYFVVSDCEQLCRMLESIRYFHKKGGKDEYARTQMDFFMIQLFTLISVLLKGKKLLTDEGGGKLGLVLEHINARLQYDINLEELAAELGMSSRYIRKIFAQQLGVSCSGYITALRMEKAKTILQESEKGITEVAALTGYNSSQYFCRVFKKYAGMTPAEFRGRMRGSSGPEEDRRILEKWEDK